VTKTNEDTNENLVLGTTEAAVCSCVTLISAVTAQPEKLCAYYLDLYYQVRSAYEREKAPPASEPLTLEAAWPRLRELIEETLHAAAKDQAREILGEMGLLQAPTPDYPEPPRTMNTPEPPQPAAPTASLDRRALPARRYAPLAGEPKKPHSHPPTGKQLDALAEAREKAATVDRSGDKNGMAMAKKAKIVIRERLLEARKNGLSNPQLLRESDGQFTEDDLWKIVEGHVVGIAIYREVNAALDRLEAKKSISA